MTDIILHLDTGTVIFPKEFIAFCIANIASIIIEVIVAFRLKAAVSLKKGILLISICNILTTFFGVTIIIICLKVWERLHYLKTSVKEFLLVFLILFIPTLIFEFLFYRIVFFNNTLKQKVVKTIWINVISYIPITLLIVITLTSK